MKCIHSLGTRLIQSSGRVKTYTIITVRQGEWKCWNVHGKPGKGQLPSKHRESGKNLWKQHLNCTWVDLGRMEIDCQELS